MSHDQNFKNLILDYPREALAFFAGAEAAAIDADASIIPIRQEQLQERLGERFRELDVPLLVEWPDGRREAILFVLEEESEARRFSIHRLAHYCLDLAELFASERVVPVVVFLRAGNYPQELTLGGERHTYLNFRYLDCNLSAIPYEGYRESDNIVARLNLPNMRYASPARLDVYAQAVRGLFGLEAHPERRLKYLDFIDIYADLDDNELQRYQRDYPEEAETMSTFAERFRQEGMEKGIQKGMQQGIQKGVRQGIQKGVRQGMQKGEAALLIRQLRRKFGELPEDKVRTIEAADTEQLLEWADRVLTAESLDEMLK
jgi:hypothetical protein